MIPPSFSQKKDLKNKILFTLSNRENITAKQIHAEIKKDYSSSSSYQAVCKALTSLLELGAIEKDDVRAYKINRFWINQLEFFCESVYKLKNKENIKVLHSKEISLLSDKKIKVISFDLDGCLSDNNFDDLFWDVEIPRLVSRDRKMGQEEAYKYVVEEYKRLWGKVDDWRDPDFWLKHFGIKESWETVIHDLKNEIKHYGDAIPTLKSLQKDYILIIVSHAARKFLNLKIKTDGLGNYFKYTFSTTDDFGSMKKDADVYRKICLMLGIKPSEIVHVGDDYEFDYAIPTSIGVRSYLINRNGKLKEEYVATNLYDFEEKVRFLG